jgi:hypothetical protein
MQEVVQVLRSVEQQEDGSAAGMCCSRCDMFVNELPCYGTGGLERQHDLLTTAAAAVTCCCRLKTCVASVLTGLGADTWPCHIIKC